MKTIYKFLHLVCIFCERKCFLLTFRKWCHLSLPHKAALFEILSMYIRLSFSVSLSKSEKVAFLPTTRPPFLVVSRNPFSLKAFADWLSIILINTSCQVIYSIKKRGFVLHEPFSRHTIFLFGHIQLKMFLSPLWMLTQLEYMFSAFCFLFVH